MEGNQRGGWELGNLGMAFGCHLGVFGAALLFFHCSEFLLALLIHGRRKVSRDSFLISKQYTIAMACALVEYGLESLFVPGLKGMAWVSAAGFLLLVFGEFIRKLAVITANHNFTHDIKTYHSGKHQLVTHGIYRLVRHPGYMGFFYWSIGTQVFLCNPLCTIAYTIVTWKFFNDRIQFEEFYLRSFFREQYLDYAKKTCSGIPFVR